MTGKPCTCLAPASTTIGSIADFATGDLIAMTAESHSDLATSTLVAISEHLDVLGIAMESSRGAPTKKVIMAVLDDLARRARFAAEMSPRIEAAKAKAAT